MAEPRLLWESPSPPVFPFTAIVGQETLKQALLLAAIDPLIGGVLAMGHRGTGKSTAVRALAQVLPPLEVVAGCRFHCDPHRPEEWCSECRDRFPSSEEDCPLPPTETLPTPVVDLPLGTTEDRLLGTLDLEKALREGVKAFEPGLLARAHRGFLYIDEVNLLEDALVDRLLDVTASGWHIVERDGLSLRHPARFVLVGSGNPEEGELRPQLVDRFGLSVTVTTPTDLEERVEILRRRDRFERNPRDFMKEFFPQEARLQRRIVAARLALPTVEADATALRWAAALCALLELDGHRGELTLIRAARAMAAWEGRQRVSTGDLRRVAPLALAHRLPQGTLHPGYAPGAGTEEALLQLEEAMARLERDPALGDAPLRA